MNKFGGLCCQRDSYAKSLSTVVLQCLPSSPEEKQYGEFAVQLEDTVLFPEGGGQVRCGCRVPRVILLFGRSLTTGVLLVVWR